MGKSESSERLDALGESLDAKLRFRFKLMFYPFAVFFCAILAGTLATYAYAAWLAKTSDNYFWFGSDSVSTPGGIVREQTHAFNDGESYAKVCVKMYESGICVVEKTAGTSADPAGGAVRETEEVILPRLSYDRGASRKISVNGFSLAKRIPGFVFGEPFMEAVASNVNSGSPAADAFDELSVKRLTRDRSADWIFSLPTLLMAFSVFLLFIPLFAFLIFFGASVESIPVEYSKMTPPCAILRLVFSAILLSQSAAAFEEESLFLGLALYAAGAFCLSISGTGILSRFAARTGVASEGCRGAYGWRFRLPPECRI